MSEELKCPYCEGTASIAYNNLLYCHDCKRTFSERDAKIMKQAARIAELEKEKSELLAKCEKYEYEIGLAKQQIAALESKSNMYIDLSVAMASTARKVDGLEKERDRLREALKEIAEFADSECGKRIPAPSCVEFLTINRYAEKALKGTGECRK